MISAIARTMVLCDPIGRNTVFVTIGLCVRRGLAEMYMHVIRRTQATYTVTIGHAHTFEKEVGETVADHFKDTLTDDDSAEAKQSPITEIDKRTSTDDGTDGGVAGCTVATVADRGAHHFSALHLCAWCGERNGGHIFMFNDRPYCCPTHRISAFTELRGAHVTF